MSMKSGSISCIVWLVLMVCSDISYCRADTPVSATNSYQLPADEKTVILRYESLGSLLPKQNMQPLLTVFANGELDISNTWPERPLHPRQLSAVELQQLLYDIIAERHFLTIDSDAIKKEIDDLSKRNGRIFAIADAPTTVITLNLPEHNRRIAVYAAESAARQFPEIEGLQDLLAIQNRLKTLMSGN